MSKAYLVKRLVKGIKYFDFLEDKQLKTDTNVKYWREYIKLLKEYFNVNGYEAAEKIFK